MYLTPLGPAFKVFPFQEHETYIQANYWQLKNLQIE